ncbi:MAG TPA: carboxypeptidase regulatory-like domain-containing protein [Pyrinomonadaceae bacterium]|nr:carboxypeptidase regulatory-like domain-containing protein [Pyrinomonadaceae bacterium]
MKLNPCTLTRFLLSMALLAMFATAAFGQETTGNIRGTVKDPNGGVVPNATVTATNPQRSFTATTDSEGTYEFMQLPPNRYTVSVTATGFAEAKRTDVPVELGRTLQVNLDLSLAGATANVNITANEEPLVDVSSTKTATNINQQKIDLLPKTLRFDSVVQTAPGTRNEGKAGGFQIDGASGSENTWIIDGLEVTRVFDGVLGNTKNIPFDFVKEVQVKSAGYEAEYGGATGGVINVATRSGSNDFHGEARLEMNLNGLAGNDRLARRFDRLRIAAPAAPSAAQLAAGVKPRSFEAEYFGNNDGKDDFRSIAPAFDLGGPILKNKLWFYGSYAPQFERTNRNLRLISLVAPGATVNGVISANGSITQLDKRNIQYRTRYDYMMGKIDFAPTSKLTFAFTGISSPTKVTGPTANLALETTSTTTFNELRYPLKGGFAPSNQISGQGTWLVTPNLIINGRLGRSYLNDKATNYDVPNAPLYSISGPCNSTISGGAPCPEGSTSNGSPNAFTSNSQTLYNITTRKSISLDAVFTKRVFGQQHSFKGGYQRNRLANNILAGSAAGSIIIHYGQNSPSCNCMGTYGYYQTNTSGQKGNVNSTNQGFFVQDSWQAHKRVTLNLGLRLENEFVPSFPLDPTGHPGLDISQLSVDPKAPIRFGWGDKIAPRLGGAWDVLGNGKLKLYGSYSVFYDTMKYNLSRGSFGGEVFVQTEKKLDTLDFRSITLANSPGALIIQRDLRVPALSNVAGPGGAVFHAVDPNIKPVREHEYTVGTDYEFRRNTVFSARYTSKNLDRTIEDIGLVFFAADGVTVQEQYMIGNPGFGTAVSDFVAFGHPPTTKAIRNYRGLELRVDKRFSDNWYTNFSYTRSRLFGNYSGLSSSDETGRNAANTNRYFDMPWITYDSHGKLSNGLLATDRPNTFKAFGAYRFNYGLFGRKQETEFSGSQFIYQGTPITTHVNIDIEGTTDGLGNFVPSFVDGRGDLGRTEAFTQTDLLVRHRVRLSERTSLLFQFNVLNLFDEKNVTDRSGSIIRTSSSTVSAGNEYNGPAAFATYEAPTFAQAVQLYVKNPGDWRTHLGVPLSTVLNPFYDKPVSFQGPRSARFSIGVQF